MAGPNQREKWTKPEKVEQARLCWQLSLDGYSQAQIAQTVGISQPTVSRRLASYERTIVLQDSEHWRKKQIERTEDLINALKPHVQPGVVEMPFVTPYLKALAQLDSYTGAAVPTKIEVTVQDDQDAQLAELIAMSRAKDQLAGVQTSVEDLDAVDAEVEA